MNRSMVGWIFSILGLIALALLIWFIGPLVAVGGREPLASDLVRLLLIFLMVVLWLLNILRKVLEANRADKEIAQGLVAAEEIGPLVPEDQARSAEESEVLRERFDEALRILRKGGGKASANLSELPWYVIIGPPGSGKTTALVNSGLEFPLEEHFGRESIQGIGGTRHCDWWFTNDAVLVDTAGRFVTQDSDRVADKAAWESFLGLLKRHRKRRPLNGVLVAISLSDLLLQDEDEREAQVRAIKGRIQELYAFFGIRFPVYVLFTKADLIAGFMEFFDDLGREERAQVWGSTFPLEEQTPIERFGEEYDALLDRLNKRLVWRLDQERDPLRRALIYGFPQQMATLKELAQDFLERVFRATRFDEQPLLRGVYLTSGTQEGTPIDRIMGAMARSVGLDYGSVSVTGARGRSYFLTDLLKRVVFGEAGLVGTNRRLERQRRWLQRAAYAVAVLATVGGVLAWSNSYTQNLRHVEKMEEHIAAYEAVAAEVPATNATFEQVLPALEALLETTRVYEEYAAATPWYMELGLYQGEKLGSGARRAYERELRRIFLPLVAGRIARQVAQATDDADFQYTALKTYLMLNRLEHFDERLLKLWMRLTWQGDHRDDPRRQDRLNAHLEALVAAGVQAVALDDDLVDAARRRLTRVPVHELVFGRLQRDAQAAQKPPFRASEVLGRAGDQVFVRASGEGLEAPIPELYTYRGYYETYQLQSRQLTGELRKESWVLGIEGDTFGEQELAALDQNLGRLYADEYVRQWRGLVEDLRIRPFSTVEEGREVLEILSSRRSPLRGLLQAVERNTALTVLPEGLGALAQAAEGAQALGGARERLLRLIGAGDDDDRAARPLSPAEMVEQRFEELNELVKDRDGDPPLDGLIEMLSRVYAHLDAVGAGEQVDGAVLRRVRQEAVSQPEPVRSWLRQVAQYTEDVTGRRQAAEQAREIQERRGELLQAMNDEWRANVLPFCNQALVGRYPIYSNAREEMTLRDFGMLFGPGALIDGFFDQHLRPFVDQGGRTWRWRPSEDLTLGLSDSLLEAFQIAARIRDTFFMDGGVAPAVTFSLRPAYLDQEVVQFQLDLEGQKFDYRHGPARAQQARWPGTDGSQQVRYFFELQGGGRSSSAREGPWAWFRILEEARLESISAERLMVTFSAEGRESRWEIIAHSVLNPFRMEGLDRFRCPERF